MGPIKLFIILSVVTYGDCFFEILLTSGQAIVSNDTKYLNLDKIRMRRVNRTEYVIVGEFEPFIELSNSYEVKKDKIFFLCSTTDFEYI